MNYNTAKLFLPGIRTKNSIRWIISFSLVSVYVVANLVCMQGKTQADELDILFDNMSNHDNSSGPTYSDFSINLASIGTNPDDISGASWSTNSDSGNDYFVAFHTHDVLRNTLFAPLNGNGNTELLSIFENNRVFYNPANQGALSSISFSLDVRLPTGAPPVGFDEIGFAIFQGSNGVSLSPLGSQLGLSNQWQTFSVTGLTEQSFGNVINFSGSSDLRFGFGFRSSFDATLGDQNFTIEADNFRVGITAVPEPSSLLFLVPALGLFAARRRKSNRK